MVRSRRCRSCAPTVQARIPHWFPGAGTQGTRGPPRDSRHVAAPRAWRRPRPSRARAGSDRAARPGPHRLPDTLAWHRMLTDSRSHTALKTRLLAVALIGVTLPGCALGYLTQAAQGQWRLMRARRPIERVIADPAASEELKARLRVVQDARDFAVSDLGLPDNRSYRSYSDLKRPFVVWNVVAAPEFSVAPQRWCFPFTGCLSYRGYFRERDARNMAAALAVRGNDVMVGGVTAYSTLGHFADPVLNTMLRYGDLELVSTMFHELAHQLIYVRGDTVFNESFAVSVEQEGLRRWLAARGRSLELQDYLDRDHGEQLMVGAFADGRPQLAALYALAPPLPVEERRARKREILVATGGEVQAVERQFKLRTGY